MGEKGTFMFIHGPRSLSFLRRGRAAVRENKHNCPLFIAPAAGRPTGSMSFSTIGGTGSWPRRAA